MIIKIRRLLLVLLASTSIVGCATLFKGTSQSISVSSVPSGADVFVDNEFKGKTPVSIKLKKNKYNTIEIRKAGYETAIQALDKKYDFVALANVFWDLSTTDLISGAAFEYDPSNYNFKLEREGTESKAK
jgi:hypothetical protein